MCSLFQLSRETHRQRYTPDRYSVFLERTPIHLGSLGRHDLSNECHLRRDVFLLGHVLGYVANIHLFMRQHYHYCHCCDAAVVLLEHRKVQVFRVLKSDSAASMVYIRCLEVKHDAEHYTLTD